MFYEKGILENLAKFTGKHMSQSLFLNNVASLMAATSIEKRLWYRCIPVNFAKALRTIFVNRKTKRLLLKIQVQTFKIFTRYCTAKQKD